MAFEDTLIVSDSNEDSRGKKNHVWIVSTGRWGGQSEVRVQFEMYLDAIVILRLKSSVRSSLSNEVEIPPQPRLD